MIDYIKGRITSLYPTELTLETYGIGYRILISLQTYQVLQGREDVTVFIFHYLREEEELYFGFATKEERELFKLLISVSGIGVNTARMMLSSLSSEEIRQAILVGDVNRIKSVKGIGLKSAQRLILELKDKVGKGAGNDPSILLQAETDAVAEEAEAALINLGYQKAAISKMMSALKKDHPNATLEEIIRYGLQHL